MDKSYQTITEYDFLFVDDNNARNGIKRDGNKKRGKNADFYGVKVCGRKQKTHKEVKRKMEKKSK